MAQFCQELLDAIWSKGLTDANYDSDHVRKDACGAWMIREQYGNRESPFGWEVDHIYPESKLTAINVPQQVINDLSNLRPLNWKNNDSKQDDYPNYHSTCKAEDDHNVDCDDEKVVNTKVQACIETLFKDYDI